MTDQRIWDAYDEVLKELGMERNRENWLWVFYKGNVPDTFGNDDELMLPPDLRIEHKL